MEAVVVGAVAYGEADRIMRFLSPTDGRVSLMARRVRSSKRRWAGILEVGNRVDLQTRKGRGGLASLQGADLIAAPRRAREDLARIALLAYGCEVCAALAPEAHAAPKLFTLLCTWLELMEGGPDPGSASRVALDSKALTFAGVSPALVRCARCGLELSGRCVFDPESGGASHPHCGGGRSVDAGVLAAIETLRRTPLADTPGFPAPTEPALLTDFIEYQLGRAVRSRALVEDALGGG